MEIAQQLESVFCTKNIDSLEDGEPFILNRFISFHPPLLETANKINKYTFKNEKKFINGLFILSTPMLYKPPFISYIKKKEPEQHEMWFLLEKVKQYYGWSERELQKQLPIILKVLENKDTMREYFRTFGVEKKHYKKYELEFSVQKKNDLNRWF
ncbi:MAG: hypothetical protein Q7R52_00100 [archaeon]|nr:hypothetical protein [archaeon]